MNKNKAISGMGNKTNRPKTEKTLHEIEYKSENSTLIVSKVKSAGNN